MIICIRTFVRNQVPNGLWRKLHDRINLIMRELHDGGFAAQIGENNQSAQ
jgi:hypothetical protein